LYINILLEHADSVKFDNVIKFYSYNQVL